MACVLTTPKAQRVYWLVLLVATVANGLLLQNLFSKARLILLASVLALWLTGVLLLRGRRILFITSLLAGLAGLGFLCLPGREVSAEQLRERYVQSLRRYEGTPYVWGGESSSGIDCSGLVREGLIQANLRVGVVTLNPRPIRATLDLWYHDCTAQDLQEGYRGFTRPLFQAGSVHNLTDPSLRAGDLAVVENGSHVMAYLGRHQWIEADPGDKVLILDAGAPNPWLSMSAHVVRWRWLE